MSDEPSFPNDRNRDGIDDDIDRRPGNERDSPGLARREDPRSEAEYTNLLSPQNLLQDRALKERRAFGRAKMRDAMRAAQQDVHFFPDVGKFIIPAQNTWAAHCELVQNNEMRLQFNPDKYFFDKIIADKLKDPALTDRNHPDFAKYKGLRTNLEVLRNDIIGMYLEDGGFDKGDEAYIPIFKSIAQTLGDALANDVWWKRPFVNYFSFDVANVEAVGAAEMYKYLLRQQDKTQVGSGFLAGLRDLLTLPTLNWGLLPIEESPFSPEALSAPSPNLERIAETPVETTREAAEARAMDSLALINATNNQFKPVDTLTEADKKISVEDGRTILRWLRNLQGVDMDVQDFLSAGSPPEQFAKAEALGNLVKLYVHQMQQFPHLHALAEVKEGSDAAGGAAMMIAEHAMTLVPEGSPAHALLASAVDTMPETHFERSHQSVARLLDHMEQGLAKMSGRQIGEKSAVDRLLEASERIHQHAQQLRSVANLDAPKREESVELGREILRKLRNMQFGDKPVEEMIDTGKPEEKAALAEKIDEMIEIYRNLLADALTANPGLAEDPRIKAANDAVGSVTHGIKLMAAKEIPNSIAQTQQISSDIANMPEEWKKLEGRAVDRLMETMEEGLAAAVDSVEQQEQDQAKDAEIAQDVIEASLMQDSSRRKRRKKRQQKSGMGGKASEKKMREIMADDRAAGQGRFGEQREQKKEEKQAAYMGLNANDMAAIKSLGTALRGANSEAKGLPMDLNGDGVVTPDEKSAAERAIEQIKNARGKPKQRGGGGGGGAGGTK